MLCTRVLSVRCLKLQHFRTVTNSVFLHQVGLQRLTALAAVQKHGAQVFSTRVGSNAADQQDSVMVRVFEQGRTLPHQQWVMRMNLQNGYLSWCRNSYLCLSVAIAVSVAPLFLTSVGSSNLAEVGDELSYVFNGLGALSICNMVFGSCEFLYQLFKTRSLTQISMLAAAIYSIFVILHAILFCDVSRSFIQCYSNDDAD
ncbi:uncharacterized protein [Watersipora subatra]|uniref:uncharacterized protein n=1 Tax=Watersipora subatra TaxID=2589382 RepID=UPI00355B1A9B